MRSDYIQSGDYNRLYSKMSYENVLVMRVCLETGLRVGDVVALPASSLDGRKITFVASKTKKSGVAVLSADLAKRLKKISGSFYIFEHRLDVKKHRTRQTVWKDLKKAYLELVELGEFEGVNVSPHSARKTFAVDEFHKHGLTSAQKKLQHSRMDNTMLYAFSDILGGGKGFKQMFDGQENRIFYSKLDIIISKIDALSEKFDDFVANFSKL